MGWTETNGWLSEAPQEDAQLPRDGARNGGQQRALDRWPIAHHYRHGAATQRTRIPPPLCAEQETRLERVVARQRTGTSEGVP